MTMREHFTDAAIAGKAQYAIYGGAGVSLFGGFTANEIAAFCGGAAALCGVIVQIIFKLRDDRRRKALNALEQARTRLEIQRLQQTTGQGGT